MVIDLLYKGHSKSSTGAVISYIHIYIKNMHTQGFYIAPFHEDHSAWCRYQANEASTIQSFAIFSR